jgi:superfamily I DNA/RNA helicase
MENRIYPDWQQLKELNNPLTDGELSLLKFLDNNLSKDHNWKKGDKLENYKGWLIFAQPFLNGSRPDIIIFNPQVGLTIYEVKDWNLNNYQFKKGEGLFVETSNGLHPIKNPIDQVNYYKEKIIGQLVPNIGEAIDSKKNNYGLIKTALYFHKSNTKVCQGMFGTKIKNRFDVFPIFGNDNLHISKIKEIVPDIDKSIYYWNKNWNSDILFWLLPPFHSIEQGTILKLKNNQLKVAEPQSGHYRVRGVAGGGKTQALAYRAGKLASQGFNVLVISFNITLWHYIKDMIARAPFNFSWGKFTFTHFHGFCKDVLNKNGIKWPKSPKIEDYSSADEFKEALETFFRLKVPNEVIKTIQNKGYLKYDAILIDEGQDYYYEWYHLLDKFFLSKRDELLIVSDKRQNIFERELDWLDKRVTRDGLEKFRTPYIDLTITFRLPREVANMSNDFSDLFDLNQELKVSKTEDLPVLVHSNHIVWLNIKEDEWEKYVYNSFLRLKKEGYSASDMVILLPNHKLGKEAVNIFNKYKVEVNHVFEDDEEATFHPHKKAFWMGDGRLKMSTIHSFKGWELLNIVLFIPSRASESNKKLDALVYTALTRTRENLIILNSNKRYNQFGEKFPKKWNEQ